MFLTELGAWLFCQNHGNAETSRFLLKRGPFLLSTIGTAFEWSAEAPASLVFMRYLGTQPGARGVTFIDNDAQLSPSGSPAADLLTSPAPSCRANSMFISDDDGNEATFRKGDTFHHRTRRQHHLEQPC